MSCSSIVSPDLFIDREEASFEEIEGVAHSWKTKAYEKYQATGDPQFSDLSVISPLFFDVRLDSEGKSNMVIARDSSNKIQAMAYVIPRGFPSTVPGKVKKYLYIELLASNPENILSPHQIKKIHGAAKAVIEEIKGRATSQGFDGVMTSAYKRSRGFYEKVGFQALSQECAEQLGIHWERFRRITDIQLDKIMIFPSD